MDRRAFLLSTGLLVAGGRPLAERLTVAAPPRARDVRDYLFSLNGGWVDVSKTVDTFKAGDPEAVVRGIAVGWMSYRWALEKAVALECNLFITHEPTYYDHLDANADMFQIEGVRRKREFIEKSGLTILRCHDVWDQVPGVGIPDSWAGVLGFSNSIGGSGYYRVFDVTGRTAADVARQVAKKVKTFGEDAVHLIGRPEARVTRVAIGTGAITSFRRMVTELNADLAICSDDGFVHWRDGALALDLGVPVIVVNHPVSEERGMALLAGRLREVFPQVPVHHIPQRCMFTVVSG